ncbi:hypothetical protein ULMS_07030 [Patiriisocius marinistellae]|uniref:Uncharacterized protein n=1 Tax=Patiriisocius marinistellae TaxID=2494560 RepID=A0A5J4FYR8_9FLAO|nr:hypothetical protein [Patiriisocius marinistellae]GEQ85195.1 hypothetical protein ULMS_07030 [Patiriisocius marinistellae]
MKGLYLFYFLSAHFQNNYYENGVNYKAVIEDSDSNTLVSHNIDIFQILENRTTNLYQETHDPVTDACGILVINI